MHGKGVIYSMEPIYKVILAINVILKSREIIDSTCTHSILAPLFPIGVKLVEFILSGRNLRL